MARVLLGTLVAVLLFLFLSACGETDEIYLPHHVSDPDVWQEGDPSFTRPARTVPSNGAVYHGMWEEMDGGTRRENLDRMAANGVDWLRMDVAWATIQPDPGPIDPSSPGVVRVGERIDEITERGIKVLIMFWWAPQWSSGTPDKSGVPGNPQDYADAIGWAANHWRDQVEAWEVWNEPDLEDFWAPGSTPEGARAYVDMARRAYDAIKNPSTGAPEATVIVGSPTYVNTDWYELFYAADPQHKFDALGVHPYLSGSDSRPDFVNPDVRFQRFTMVHIGRLVEMMASHGDSNKAIWATEYGWADFDNSGSEPVWQRGVTQQEQAQYALGSQDVFVRFPQVRATFWYNSRDKATGHPIEDHRGLTTRSNQDKPVLKALKCINTGICGPPDAEG